MAASSSSDPAVVVVADGDASIDGSLGVAAAIDPTPICKHEGVTFLDQAPDGCFVVTHTQTLECKRVPADHDWMLVFEDGMGALCSQSTEQVIFLDDWLDFNLYMKNGTETMIRSDGSGRGSRSLIQWQRSYEEVRSLTSNT